MKQPRENKTEYVRLGIALSGGGTRAAVFHLGVLKRLAEAGMLESVHRISTVSGGSLATAAVFSHSEMQWPSSRKFLQEVYPTLRHRMTSTDLFTFRAVGVAGLFAENLKLVTHRAEVLSRQLEKRWNVKGLLADLPETPRWDINATCIETGKNWRFSRQEMGDWVFGRHYRPPYTIALAAASSAAVPYAIGALHLKIPGDGWWATDPATGEPLRGEAPTRKTVRLWDGGAYENLGLEPLYKPGEGLRGCDFLICSDASGLLGEPSFSFLKLLRGSLSSPRLFDVAGDQIRALRLRMLMNAVRNDQVEACIVRMGTTARSFHEVSGRKGLEARIANCLLEDECRTAHEFETGLSRVPEASFDLISRHGSETMEGTALAYAPEHISRAFRQ